MKKQTFLGVVSITMLGASLGCSATSGDASDPQFSSEQGEAKSVGQSVIFGADNRLTWSYKTRPWSAVGRVVINGGICTGTMIGPKRMLTASHCIGGGFQTPSDVTFEINRVNGTPSATAHGTRVFRGVPGDFAFVDLDANLGTTYGTWPIDPTPLAVGQQVNRIGYDADRFLDTPGAHFGCNVKKINVDIWEGVQTDCDLIGGGSGGPLFTYIGNQPAIAGVASTTDGNYTVPSYTLDGPQNTHSPTTQIYDYPMKSAEVGVGWTGNGRLQVYISDLDASSIKSKWQQTTTSSGPLGFTHYINFTPPGDTPGAIAVTRLTDGRQQVFYLRSGSLYTKFQTSVDGGWVTPYATPTPGNGIGTDLATVELLDGTPMLFVSTSDGKLYYKQKVSADPSAGWTGWTDISPTGWVSRVSVVRHPGGTLNLFVARTDGTVASRVRASNGDWWGWGEFDSSHHVVDLAAGKQGNGRAQLFEIDDAGHLFTIWKTAQDDYSSWGTWTPIGYFFGLPSTRSSTILKAISVGTLPDGRLELFGVSSDATPYTLVQTTANDPGEFGDPAASSRFWMEF